MPPSSLDAQNTNTVSTGDGGGNTLTGISTALNPIADNDLLVALAHGVANSGDITGGSPGTGWFQESGLNFVNWRVLSPPAPQNIAQSVGTPCYSISQFVAAFKVKPGRAGSINWTLRGSGSGGTTLSPATFTPAAGNSLFWAVSVGGASGPGNTTVLNPGGMPWQLLANFGTFTTTGGFGHGTNIIVWYAENIPAVSSSPSISVVNGGDWALWEIDGILSGSLRLLASTGVGI
jgi:hypothetical protein